MTPPLSEQELRVSGAASVTDEYHDQPVRGSPVVCDELTVTGSSCDQLAARATFMSACLVCEHFTMCPAVASGSPHRGM